MTLAFGAFVTTTLLFTIAFPLSSLSACVLIRRWTIVGQMFSQLAGGQLPALTPALRLALRAQLRSWDVRAVLVEATGQRPALVLPFFEWLLGRPPDARSGGINAWYE